MNMAHTNDFVPEEIDTQNQPILQSLRQVYRNSPEDARSLAEIQERLLATTPLSLQGPHAMQELAITTEPHNTEHQINPLPPWRVNARGNEPLRRLRSYAMGLVAIVVVSLLIGSFVLLFASRHGTPGVVHQPDTTATRIAPGSPTPSSVNQTSISIHMIDVNTGWVVTTLISLQGSPTSQVWRTTDGGANFQDVTPKQRTPLEGSIDADFLDASMAWLAVAQSTKTLVVLRTSDGGQTWQQATVQSQTSPVLVGNFLGSQITFINKEDGWIEGHFGVASGSEAVVIYHTTDEGRTWTKVSSASPDIDPNAPGILPFSGDKSGLGFVDASTGWATGTEPANGFSWLYVTHDAGRTWQHQTLPIPAGILPAQVETDPPTFFTAHEGILPVRLVTEQGTLLYLYVTHDGGTTWHSSTPLPADLPDFLDVNLGWVTDLHTVYATRDGGQHWTKLTTFQAPQSITTPDFVTSDIGWAIGGTNTSQSLLKTTDGGYTWKTIFTFQT